MSRVLFVDDEKNVLAALENALRRRRPRWEAIFAAGAAAALAALEQTSFDVVVTDLRMPSMDGPELLATVEERQPWALRFVLTGHTEADAGGRLVALAHQTLGKPCDAQALRQVIDRACRLRAAMASEAVQAAIGDPRRFAPPTAYRELSRALLRADATARDPANVIARDALLASAILGWLGSVRTIQEAASRYGVAALGGLALAAHAGITIGWPSSTAADRMATARLAAAFVRDHELGAIAFTAALVRDVAWPLADPAVHAAAGAAILSAWGLPLELLEAVAGHHAPGGSPSVIAAAVHAATALGPEAAGDDIRLDLEALGAAGVADEVPRWRALAEEEARVRRHDHRIAG